MDHTTGNYLTGSSSPRINKRALEEEHLNIVNSAAHTQGINGSTQNEDCSHLSSCILLDWSIAGYAKFVQPRSWNGRRGPSSSTKHTCRSSRRQRRENPLILFHVLKCIYLLLVVTLLARWRQYRPSSWCPVAGENQKQCRKFSWCPGAEENQKHYQENCNKKLQDGEEGVLGCKRLWKTCMHGSENWYVSTCPDAGQFWSRSEWILVQTAAITCTYYQELMSVAFATLISSRYYVHSFFVFNYAYQQPFQP